MDGVPKNRIVIYGVLTSVCLAIDLWSKHAAFAEFPLYTGTDWLLDGWVRFRLHTSLNKGALWGMGQGLASVFATLSVVAFVGILIWLFFRGGARSLWLTVSLAFVSGGTLGNLYDRLGVRIPDHEEPVQAVRDFLHFQFGGTIDKPGLDWAIFNVADVCLVTGAIMLMIQSFQKPQVSLSEAEILRASE